MNSRQIIGLNLFVFITISAAQFNTFSQRNNFVSQTPANQLRAFPDCLSNTRALDSLLNPNVLKSTFDRKLQEEDNKLFPSASNVSFFHTGNILDFTDAQLQQDVRNAPLVARAAIKFAEEILRQMSCATTKADALALNAMLKKIRLPPGICAFESKPNCNGLTNYRTLSGICNNILRPYEGSARTAFARLLPPAYEDGLHLPRSRSVFGGELPGCRAISLNLGSTPEFNTGINHHWVIYGQYLTHDITASLPLVESGRQSIARCPCESTDVDVCNIIPIPANDPMMNQQQCINTTTTSQALSNTDCTLGYKEQMNGNSHFIDLSPTYGSTRATAANLRTRKNGFMKIFRTGWSKYELPPGEVENQSCMDGAENQRCFAGGDSRIMENVVLAAIQSQWLRAHNRFAFQLSQLRTDWGMDDDLLYEEARKLMMALHQHYTYELWLPILLGSDATEKYISHDGLFSKYDPETPGVVFNDVVAGVLRMHTFVRDAITRCRPDGELIDQVRLNDVLGKAKLAYDMKNNGLDAFLCGALHDYSYSGDGNYAEQMHHHLFESINHQGKIIRRDIIAMNICRGREHGIPGYNAYRELCNLPRAQQFEDFADTMPQEAILKLKSIYQHPEDVDLIVGANHETPLPGAAVGHVSVCLLATQFRHLKYGDRFFYTHQGEFTPGQLIAIKSYPPHCFHCQTGDLEFVARNPFRPPHDTLNPRQLCSECPNFDFSAWSR